MRSSGLDGDWGTPDWLCTLASRNTALITRKEGRRIIDVGSANRPSARAPRVGKQDAAPNHGAAEKLLRSGLLWGVSKRLVRKLGTATSSLLAVTGTARHETGSAISR